MRCCRLVRSVSRASGLAPQARACVRCFLSRPPRTTWPRDHRLVLAPTSRTRGQLVTPEGVLRPAKCNARATRAGRDENVTRSRTDGAADPRQGRRPGALLMFSLALAGRDLALGHNPAQVCSKMRTHECGAREKEAAKQTSMRACNRLGRARRQEASEVKRRRAWLVPGWGTAHGRYWRSAGRRPFARRRPDVRRGQNLDPRNSVGTQQP